MQLASFVVGVVHAADAQTQFEPQGRIVAQRLGHRRQLLAPDLQRQLVAINHHPLDRLRVTVLAQCRGQCVDHLVEKPAVGAWRTARQRDGADETAIPGRVTGATGAEHATAHPDDLGRIDVGLWAGTGAIAVFCHLSKPLSSMVGVTDRAAFSASRIASSR